MQPSWHPSSLVPAIVVGVVSMNLTIVVPGATPSPAITLPTFTVLPGPREVTVNVVPWMYPLKELSTMLP